MLIKGILSEPYKILKERLAGSSTELTTFYFHRGANIYAFTYNKEGVKKHTFIDSGDSRYRNKILSILVKNNLLISQGGRYGKMYFISPLLEEQFELFEDIWAKIGQKNKFYHDDKKGERHE